MCSVGLALLCAAFAGGCAWRDAEQAGVRQKAALASAAESTLRAKLEATVADLTRERDELRGQGDLLGGQVKELVKKLAESEARLAKETEALNRATAQAKAQPAPAAGANPMKAMSEIMKTPAMKDAVVQQNLAQIDMMYGKLFDKLQLEGPDKQDFKNLITERMRAELELSVQMMGGDFSAQQSAAVIADLNKAKAASDQKIRSFLSNDADYQIFQNWEDTKPERMALNMMGASVFAGTGEPLSAAQEDQLVAAMVAARKSATGVPDMTKPESLTPANVQPQMTERILASYDAQAAKVATGASAYLSPAQLEALKSFQKQQRAMQEMGLKMGASMMGGK